VVRMANAGKIIKSYGFYVDEETASEAIPQGALVQPVVGASTIEKTDGDATDLGPYGIALTSCTAASDKILVQWRGVGYVTCTAAARFKNALVITGSAAAGAVMTAAADTNLCVGHVLEATTTSAADVTVKLMLKEW